MKLKKVIISENSTCPKCGISLFDIANIKYLGETKTYPTFSEELYECRKCKNVYIVKIPLFDSDNHLKSLIFSDDINDSTHSWKDNLAPEQISVVENHLQICQYCRKKVDDEVLENALFSNLLSEDRKRDSVSVRTL